MVSYFITFLIGAFVGFGELLNRFRNGKLIFRSWTGYVYLLINGGASVLTYSLMDYYNLWFDGFTSKEPGRIIFCGLSAMFFLRSSFFVYKPKDSEPINIGLASFIQIFLDYAERSFDRLQSIQLLTRVRVVMRNVDFEKAEKDIATICLTLMKDVSSEEQIKLAEEIKKLSTSGLKFAETRSLAMGILVSEIAGADLLEEAVETIRNKISFDNGDDPLSLLNSLQDQLKPK